jgi:glycosyltransferase involved in cell wall biosynthesis
MTGAPVISVVIPTYQRCASVRRALEALSVQTLPASDFEVIVSIDGSDDGTSELVAEFTAPYVLRGLWHPHAGRASACNVGVAASRGEITVLLDDDMEPLPGCLQAHCQAHETQQPRAVLGAVPVALDEDSHPAASYIREKFERHGAKLAQSGYRIGFRDFYSGNLSMRRDILVEVGLFDARFKVYGNEDSELALRLLGAGVELVYSRAAAATQHYEKDFAALARDNAAKGKTAVLCLQKYPETIASLRQRLYRDGSWKWRLVRRVLLAMTAAARPTPDLVVRFVRWQERRRSPKLHRYYRLALDYFFWLGAGPELKEWRRREGVASL